MSRPLHFLCVASAHRAIGFRRRVLLLRCSGRRLLQLEIGKRRSRPSPRRRRGQLRHFSYDVKCAAASPTSRTIGGGATGSNIRISTAACATTKLTSCTLSAWHSPAQRQRFRLLAWLNTAIPALRLHWRVPVASYVARQVVERASCLSQSRAQCQLATLARFVRMDDWTRGGRRRERMDTGRVSLSRA